MIIVVSELLILVYVHRSIINNGAQATDGNDILIRIPKPKNPFLRKKKKKNTKSSCSSTTTETEKSSTDSTIANVTTESGSLPSSSSMNHDNTSSSSSSSSSSSTTSTPDNNKFDEFTIQAYEKKEFSSLFTRWVLETLIILLFNYGLFDTSGGVGSLGLLYGIVSVPLTFIENGLIKLYFLKQRNIKHPFGYSEGRILEYTDTVTNKRIRMVLNDDGKSKQGLLSDLKDQFAAIKNVPETIRQEELHEELKDRELLRQLQQRRNYNKQR